MRDDRNSRFVLPLEGSARTDRLTRERRVACIQALLDGPLLALVGVEATSDYDRDVRPYGFIDRGV